MIRRPGTGHSDTSSNAATTPGPGSQTAPVGGSGNGTPASNPSGSSPTPQDGAAQYASNGYIPEECGLPAGCGGVSNTNYVTHPPSLTVGNVPVAHNSQGSTPPNDGPTPPGRIRPPGPAADTSVTAAPELDPETLAAAVTLLLGSLAVLSGRRVRVSRTSRPRLTR